jgi:hypothetical protein
MNFDTSIGIKQVIRYEWMKYTVDLLTSGLKKEDIRKELENYLSERKGNGKTGNRAGYTMTLAVTLLMNIWVTPKPELISFRDRLLKMIKIKEIEPVCHWAMVSSVYPFWFNMSYIFGSLFLLQDQIKKSQIMSRVYEIFGERNTIERCSRYVIRSFVAWDIIKDKEKTGYYEKRKIIKISDISLASLLIETMLNAVPEKRIPLASIISCPSFFNFEFPSMNGSQITKVNQNLEFEQFSLNEEFVKLRNIRNKFI